MSHRHPVEKSKEPFRIDLNHFEAILPRYDTTGPRYTSYPTAPTWKENFGPDDYRLALRDLRSRADQGLALYAHVPFCNSLCHFCACNRIITQKEELPEKYLDTIEQEIEQVREAVGDGLATSQLHWGGGTPTHLTPAQIKRLFQALTRAFPLAKGAEVSIEVDPRVTTEDHIAALGECGFNRISMGVQDLDPTVQQAVHRIQPIEMTIQLIERARGAGMLSANLDLIYGLPFQTLESFSHTLDHILEIAPDRIALYAYAHVTWKAKQQRGFKDSDLPTPSTRLRIMLRAIQRFIDAGYEYIGMDHFALPTDDLAKARRDRTLRRNFMGYTTQSGVDLLGFGPSAISELHSSYAQSARTLDEWQRAIEAGTLPTIRGQHLTEDDQERHWIISRIFCHSELRAVDYRTHFGKELANEYAQELSRLEPMQRDGLVQCEPDGSFFLTPLGRLLVRNVAMPFDAYLPDQLRSEKPLFSKTI